jgi:hypothetical protein
LHFSPVRHAVTVQHGVQASMPDGVILVADHYAPRY